MPNPLFSRFDRAKKNAPQPASSVRETTRTRRVVDSVLSTLGRAGRIIRDTLRREPSGASQQVYNEAYNEMMEFLGRQSRADRRQETQQETTEPPATREKPTHAVIRFNGSLRRYRLSDPIVTGKMVRVESSNVHSIGYRMNWDNPQGSELIVRFLDKRKGRVQPGAFYGYQNVPPDLFQQFQRAISKGEFVWDELRVRGTVSGHRFAYKLRGVMTDGYVPRRATRIGDEEHYMPRTVKTRHSETGERQTRRSELPAAHVRNVAPGRGTPSRGTPTRGR